MDAWKAISAFIRKRDPYCVTCLVEGIYTPTAHCGHYRHNSERNQSLGGNALWFDERNLNGQCVKCNNYKSGNLDSYALYLTRTYGSNILEEIRALYHSYKKWTREEIEEVTRKYGR